MLIGIAGKTSELSNSKDARDQDCRIFHRQKYMDFQGCVLWALINQDGISVAFCSLSKLFKSCL